MKDKWDRVRQKKRDFKLFRKNKYKGKFFPSFLTEIFVGIFKHKGDPVALQLEARLCKSIDISKKDRTKFSYVDKVVSAYTQINKENSKLDDKHDKDEYCDTSNDDDNSIDDFYTAGYANKSGINSGLQIFGDRPIVKLELDKKENEMSLQRAVIGNFEDDEPVKVLGMKRSNNKIYARLQWKRRKEGIEPGSSYYPIDVVKKK
jgi:hypothetical protein